MGTVLQERVARRCLERGVSVRETEWRRKKAPWSNNWPDEASNTMGRRQSQRKSAQPQCTVPSQENNNDKRLQQRSKHKPHAVLTKRNTCQHSAQGTLASKSHHLSTAEDRIDLKMHPAAQRYYGQGERKHTGLRGSRRTPAYPCLSDSNPELLERHSPPQEVRHLKRREESDSDTDLSESERLPLSSSGRVPPQLELRPDVIEAEDCSTHSHRPRGQGRGFDFPDFLPPPFNSWSLSQLAVFYNMEGVRASRPRPVGCLERYLERLLQLEWRQIQTVKEGSGRSVSDVISTCHRSSAAVSSRLSSPKCILQCQRAFPLTFLSSLASHSTLLSGCACTLFHIRHSTCNTSCSWSSHSHTRPSRISPTLERRVGTSLPKRSYSESRVHSSDRSAVSRAQRFSSPLRANSHLRRMQASGNIRNPTHGANTKPHSPTRDSSFGAQGDTLDYREGGFRKRSDSEQRRVREEHRQQHGSEKRRSGSECRRGGNERRRTAELKEREIKTDAVTAIMDHLPGSKCPPVHRPNRPKQVEFVT
ncbi:uncharacterized protein LOC118309407 [Scophthalmus maximus]|uniref:uncharacterized protein LOC118309407 n=1 Tax=Scophthalmus maximus TaxID=52904 RepID=UPI001FA91BEE|nr:uncharacterized protein LOC118309407 [Scophthalmus maximus]